MWNIVSCLVVICFLQTPLLALASDFAPVHFQCNTRKRHLLYDNAESNPQFAISITERTIHIQDNHALMLLLGDLVQNCAKDMTTADLRIEIKKSVNVAMGLALALLPATRTRKRRNEQAMTRQQRFCSTFARLFLLSSILVLGRTWAG